MQCFCCWVGALWQRCGSAVAEPCCCSAVAARLQHGCRTQSPVCGSAVAALSQKRCRNDASLSHRGGSAPAALPTAPGLIPGRRERAPGPLWIMPCSECDSISAFRGAHPAQVSRGRTTTKDWAVPCGDRDPDAPRLPGRQVPTERERTRKTGTVWEGVVLRVRVKEGRGETVRVRERQGRRAVQWSRGACSRSECYVPGRGEERRER